MQLMNLVKPIEDMTDDELREQLRAIRHNRKVIRPAAQKHKEKVVKKESKAKTSKVEALIKNLTPEQIKQLLLNLGEG